MRPAYAWFPAAAVVVVVFGPLAYFLSRWMQLDAAPEFVYYRIGDALSLMGGEGAYVRPVQGIPNAILSKLAVWIVGESVVTRDGSRAYGLIFTLLLAVPVVASIVYAWRKLPVAVALAQALILALPFGFGSVSHGLMVAPDYWQAELAFLGITLPLLYMLPKMPADRAYLIAGVWAGVGASIKVTLFPVSLLLVVCLRGDGPQIRTVSKRVAVMLAASLLTFAALDLIYMADFVQAAKLLKFQALFFLKPNASAFYADFWSAFTARPIVPLLAAALLILCAAKRTGAALAMLGWFAAYLYLVAKRPHDTSMASLAISLGFMVTFAALQFERRAAVLSALVAVAVAGASLDNFYPLRSFIAAPRAFDAENVARADSFFSAAPAVWFIPSNDWNATYGPQGWAYNGGLATRPREKRGVFRKLFPGTDVALNLGEVPALFADGAVIYWTRPIDSDSRPLFAALEGARIEEQPGTIRGDAWIFGEASYKTRQR